MKVENIDPKRQNMAFRMNSMRKRNYPRRKDHYHDRYESVFPTYKFFPIAPSTLKACINDYKFQAYCHFSLEGQSLSITKIDLLQIAETLPEILDKMDECQEAIQKEYKFSIDEPPFDFQVGARNKKQCMQPERKIPLMARKAAGRRLPPIAEEEEGEEESIPDEDILHVDPECEIQSVKSLVLKNNAK